MGGHTLTSDTLPRGIPPPHSLQQLTTLLWCVEEIVMVKPDMGTPFLIQKSGKDTFNETTPDHFDVGPIATLHC